MEVLKGKTVDELPVIEWEEASCHCNGGTRDDCFLAELLGCFFDESGPRLRNIISAALVYRQGEATVGAKAVETIIREEAHALKGSAANVKLLRLSKAAENVELPIKLICRPHAPPGTPVDEVAKKALLDCLCSDPGERLGVLLREFRGFVSFMEGPARELVTASVPAGQLAEAVRWVSSVSTVKLDEQLTGAAAAFWTQGPTAAPSAAAPATGAAQDNGGSSGTTAAAPGAPAPLKVDVTPAAAASTPAPPATDTTPSASLAQAPPRGGGRQLNPSPPAVSFSTSVTVSQGIPPPAGISDDAAHAAASSQKCCIIS